MIHSKRAQAVVFDSVFLHFFRILLDISDRLRDVATEKASESGVDPGTSDDSGKGIYDQYSDKKKPKKKGLLKKLNGHSIELPYEYIKEEPSKERINDDPNTFLQKTDSVIKGKIGKDFSDVKTTNLERYDDKTLTAVQANAEYQRKFLPGASGSGNLGADIGHLIDSAYDNTVGYFIAKGQNRRTVKDLKKDKSKPIMYLMNGIVLNEGSHHRLAKKLKEQGFAPYHIPASHLTHSKEYILKKTYDKIKKLHKNAGISEEDAKTRYDGFSGHSDGGNFVISSLAPDYKTRDLGIKWAQARAASPYGMPFRTRAIKAIGAMLPTTQRENIETKEGKELATKTYMKHPVIPIHTYAGQRDKLVPPKYSRYVKEMDYTFIPGKYTSHFATSGASNAHNDALAKEAKKTYKKLMGEGDYYIKGD